MCEAPNDADLAHCTFCGAPAVLSALHADILRRNLRGEPHPAQDLRDFRIEQALDRLPTWKRVLAYICLVVGVACIAIVKFTLVSVWTVFALVIGLPSLLGYGRIMASNKPPEKYKETP